MLKESEDYFLHKDEGYIVLNSSLQSGEYIGVLANIKDEIPSFERSLGKVNTTNPNIDYDLKIIGAYNQTWSDQWSQLEWKNVYHLGNEVGQENFELEIGRSADGETKNNYLTFDFIEWFQINKDETEKNKVSTYFLQKNGDFIFPNLMPLDPKNGKIRNDLLEIEDPDSTIFDQSIYRERSPAASKFNFNFTFYSTSSTHRLGFNVIEGSETVRSGGVTLVKDKDYIIDYYTGELAIIKRTKI